MIPKHTTTSLRILFPRTRFLSRQCQNFRPFRVLLLIGYEVIYKIRRSYYYARMIGIVDYNAGNIKSVEHALESLGFPFTVSKRPSELAHYSRLIVPGVGEAAYAIHELSRTGFDSFLKDWSGAKKPLLGICLGSQIIFDYSEEGDTSLDRKSVV